MESKNLVYVDLTKKIAASGMGRKLVALGFKNAGTYDLVNDVYNVKVRLPLYASEKSEQISLFHSINPHLVVSLINGHPNYAALVSNSQEAKNIVDTVGGLDFSSGFDMSSVMGMLLPLVTNKSGLKFRMELAVGDVKLNKDYETATIDEGDSSEDLTVETSILNKNLLSHPKVSKLVGGLIPGLGGGTGKKNEFF